MSINIVVDNQIVEIPLCSGIDSPLKIYANGGIKELRLVDVEDASATKIQIYINGMFKAISNIC